MQVPRLITPLLLAMALGTGIAQADILIGTAGPFTGPNATLGEQIRRGTQKAIDDINATGGLRGERLVLKAEDDGCDPRKAVDVATRFVSEGVRFVAGHYCSGASIPASKVYGAANIVQISPASTYGKYTDDGGWNVLRICPRDDAQGTVAGRLIASRFPAGRIAILNDQSPASTALAMKLREALAAANITPAIDEGYKPGARDYSILAQKLRDARIDVVYLGGSYVESGLIVSAMRELGSSAQFVGSDALVTEDFWKSAKDTAEGTLMTFMADPRKFASARAVAERFASDEYAPEGHTLYAYAAVEAWVKAAEATGTTDSHRIAEWLKSGNRINTVTGEVAFDARGDLKEPVFAWFRWTEGRYEEIDPATLEPPEPSPTP